MADWRTFVWTVDITAGITTGQLYMIQETVCVAFVDAQGNADPSYDEVASMIYHAEKIRVPKDASNFLVGDKVYWSGTNGDPVTATFVSGYYWIGICVVNSGTSESYVIIDLKGDKATVGA